MHEIDLTCSFILQCLCRWTISLRRYHTLSNNCFRWIDTSAERLLVPEGVIHPSRESFGTDMVYKIYLLLKCTVPK